MSETESACPRIVVVGPCAAGKSTLVANLRPQGYDIRSCVQEHSYMPDLWRRFSKAEVLIFLDAQLETIAHRQKRSDWTQDRLDVQQRRLAHARAHCDFYLATDDLRREEVAERVRMFLQGRQIVPCADR
jgi:guanylate kinase